MLFMFLQIVSRGDTSMAHHRL